MESVEEDLVPETMDLNKFHENDRKGDYFYFLNSILLLFLQVFSLFM